MENKINIAELLKDCPSGMELDCTMYEDVYFDLVNNYYNDTINCYTLIDGIRTSITFTKYGTFNNHTGSKCVIFPKGKTTWEGFQRPFEDGDVVVAENAESFQLFLLKHLTHSEDDNNYDGYCYFGWNFQCNNLFEKGNWGFNRLATEEEKAKLFDAIKKHGYKWNEETKTLEELVESNEDVDDRVVMSGIYFDRENYADEVELHLGNYDIEIRDGKTYAVFKNQETKTLEKLPKFNVGDRVRNKNYKDYIYDIHDITDKGYRAKEIDADSPIIILFGSEEDNYELIPDKFDIATLKPYDQVLYRMHDKDTWCNSFYSFYKSNHHFVTSLTIAKQCIPYNEDTKHLLGTTDDCDEYFKTWE